MTLGRLVLILIALAAGFWLLTRTAMFSMKGTPGEAAVPADRARTAAAASSSRAGGTDAAQAEADAPAPSGTITEDMSPDQVRSLLGPPEEVLTESTETGGTRERWLYRRVGKTVVFENGAVVRVE